VGATDFEAEHALSAETSGDSIFLSNDGQSMPMSWVDAFWLEVTKALYLAAGVHKQGKRTSQLDLYLTAKPIQTKAGVALITR